MVKICAPNPKGKTSTIPNLCEDLISRLQVCCMAAGGCWRVAKTKANTFSQHLVGCIAQCLPILAAGGPWAIY